MLIFSPSLVAWCHVVCALFIPEAWFANVQTMEPIVLKNVPQERFNKVKTLRLDQPFKKRENPSLLHCTIKIKKKREIDFTKKKLEMRRIVGNVFKKGTICLNFAFC